MKPNPKKITALLLPLLVTPWVSGIGLDAVYFAKSDVFYGDQILVLSHLACPAKVTSVSQNTLSNMGITNISRDQMAWSKSRLDSAKFGVRAGCWTTVTKGGEEWVFNCNAYADGMAGDECAVVRKDSFKLSNGMPATSLIRKR
jgi:hypothetical protein